MSATDSVDLVQGIHILASGSAGLSLPAGKVGNALQTTQRVSIATNDEPLLARTSPQFALSGWCNPSTGAEAAYLYYWNSDPVGEAVDFLVQMDFSGAHNGGHPGRMEVYRNVNGDDEPLTIDSPIPITGSGWFFFVFQNGPLNTFQYSINNSALASTGATLSYPNTSKGTLEILTCALGGFFGQTILFDELAFWETSLTQDNISTLWNGGTGVTWPVTL